MTPELLRDKTIAGFETFLDSKTLKRFCWAAMILAVLYFGSAFARMWAR
jgi:hypothetical protein